MSLLDIFRTSKRKSATVAKDRLQVIIAHSRMERNAPDYFPRLKQDLLDVIKRYVKVESNDVQVSLDRDENYEILELNITIPNTPSAGQGQVSPGGA